MNALLKSRPQNDLSSHFCATQTTLALNPKSKIFFGQCAPVFVPQRKHDFHANLGAHFFFPIAVRLQINVAKHSVSCTASLQFARGTNELRFIRLPTRTPRHQFAAERTRLLLQKRERNGVRARQLARFVHHCQQKSHIQTALPRAMNSQGAIFAAAPRTKS